MSIDKISMVAFRDEYTGILVKEANPFKGFIKKQVKQQLGNITAATTRGTANAKKNVQGMARAGTRTISRGIAGTNNAVQGYKTGLRGKKIDPSKLQSVSKSGPNPNMPVSGGITPTQSLPALAGSGAGSLSRMGAMSAPGMAAGAEMAQPGSVTSRVGNIINKAGRKLSQAGNKMSTRGLNRKPGIPAPPAAIPAQR